MNYRRSGREYKAPPLGNSYDDDERSMHKLITLEMRPVMEGLLNTQRKSRDMSGDNQSRPPHENYAFDTERTTASFSHDYPVANTSSKPPYRATERASIPSGRSEKSSSRRPADSFQTMSPDYSTCQPSGYHSYQSPGYHTYESPGHSAYRSPSYAISQSLGYSAHPPSSQTYAAPSTRRGIPVSYEHQRPAMQPRPSDDQHRATERPIRSEWLPTTKATLYRGSIHDPRYSEGASTENAATHFTRKGTSGGSQLPDASTSPYKAAATVAPRTRKRPVFTSGQETPVLPDADLEWYKSEAGVEKKLGSLVYVDFEKRAEAWTGENVALQGSELPRDCGFYDPKVFPNAWREEFETLHNLVKDNSFSLTSCLDDPDGTKRARILKSLPIGRGGTSKPDYDISKGCTENLISLSETLYVAVLEDRLDSMKVDPAQMGPSQERHHSTHPVNRKSTTHATSRPQPKAGQADIDKKRRPKQSNIGWYNDQKDWNENKRSFYHVIFPDKEEGVLDVRTAKSLKSKLRRFGAEVNRCDQNNEPLIQEFLFGALKNQGRLEYNPEFGCTCNVLEKY